MHIEKAQCAARSVLSLTRTMDDVWDEEDDPVEISPGLKL